MTRVEKYHQYREEILNTNFTNNSGKICSNNIEKDNNNKYLSYDQVIESFDIQEKRSNKIKSLQIAFVALLIAVIITLVILLIIK